MQERDNTQAKLSQLSASLDASNALVDTLQKEVQEHKDQANGLQQTSDGLRQQLEQQHEANEQVTQQLAEAQDQLATTNRELTQAKEMVRMGLINVCMSAHCVL